MGLSWGGYGPLRASWLACAALWLRLGPFIFERLRHALGPLLAARITGNTPPMDGTALASSRTGAAL